MATDELIAKLQARIRQLEDVQSIKDLKASFGMDSDRGASAGERAAMFAPDATLEIERYETARGTVEIAQFFSHRRFSWMFHCMIPLRVEVAPDGLTASGAWRLWELATRPATADSPESAVWVGGLYEDDFVKIDDTWKFSHLRLKLELISPYDQGWLRQRFIA